MMMVVWLVAVMLAFAAKVLLLSFQVGANKGKVVKFDSGWLVRMGSEFSVVILRNLTRGEFSVGTKRYLGGSVISRKRGEF